MSNNSHPHHLDHEKTTHYPLIDGIYAIALTLLALEFPALISDIALNPDLSTLSGAFTVFLILLEYILVFLVLYEVWSFHRAILFASESSQTRRENIFSILALAFTSLVPGATILVCRNIVHHASMLFSPTYAASAPAGVYPHAPFFELSTRILVFVMLLCIAKSSVLFRSTIRLQIISRHLLNRTLFFSTLALLSMFIARFDVPLVKLCFPVLPLLLYVFVGFAHDKFIDGFTSRS